MKELLKKLLNKIMLKENKQDNVIQLPQNTLAKDSKNKLLKEKQQMKKAAEAQSKNKLPVNKETAKRKTKRKKAN